MVDEQNVVFLGPRVFIENNFNVEFSLQKERTKFLEVAELGRTSWASVEPDDGGDVFEVGSVFDVPPAVEQKGKR